MSGITISKEHGLNPSIEKCFVCGKEMGIILFGTAYKENGKVAKAPMEMVTGNLCKECTNVIKSGGCFFIEVKDGESGDNPYRTGRLVGVDKDWAQRVLKVSDNIMYMEQKVFNNIFGEFLKKKNGTEKL